MNGKGKVEGRNGKWEMGGQLGNQKERRGCLEYGSSMVLSPDLI